MFSLRYSETEERYTYDGTSTGRTSLGLSQEAQEMAQGTSSRGMNTVDRDEADVSLGKGVEWLLRVKGVTRKMPFLSVKEAKRGRAGVCLGGESWQKT